MPPVSDDGGGSATIGILGSDNTMSVFASANGSSGPTVSINKALMLSALTVDRRFTNITDDKAFQDAEHDANVFSFAAENIGDAINLDGCVSRSLYPGDPKHCNLASG